MEEKVIGGIAISKWKEVFRELCEIAMDKDYFSDILFYDLYPETSAEAAAIDDDDEDAQCDVYNAKWEYVDEALDAIFGERN